MYKINNVAESINGVKTFGNRVNLYGQTALIVGDGTATSGGAEFNGQTTFNTKAPISNTSPTLSTHLTTKNYTDSTFQTILNMVNYLTTTAAASTYQTIANMSNYLTTTAAASTYQTIANMSNYLTKTETNALMPVGSIHMMSMGTVPTGFLECNGQYVSISTYPALSAYLNFTYGGSAPSGLFQVPDFRGMFLRGKGTNGINSNYASSSSYGMMQSDGIKSHTHNILFGFCPTANTNGGGNAYNSTSPNYNNPGGLSTGRATGYTDTNPNPDPDTRPGNFPVLYCIKY
jgi:microcystin-dependent protein